MSDPRTLQEITAAHPVPWTLRTASMVINGQALIQVIDKAGQEVPLFTMLRVVQLVADKLATQPAKA